MSKKKERRTSSGQFPIDEFRTDDYRRALEKITLLFNGRHQFSVSYLGDEIIINYTTGPHKG